MAVDYYFTDLKIVARYNAPRYMSWRTGDLAMEQYHQIGTLTRCVASGVVLFEGVIMECTPMADESGEYLIFKAIGGWEYLNSHIFNKDGKYVVKYNHVDEGQELLTAGEIVKDIIAHSNIPGWVISGYYQSELNGMTVKPPALTFNGITIGDAIKEVLQYQATYGAYVQPSDRKIRFVNFSTGLTQRDVFFGQWNEHVGSHPEYNVISANLMPTAEGCITKVIVEGSGEYRTVEDELSPDWDSQYESDWDFIKMVENPDTYGRVYRCYKTTDLDHLPWLEASVGADGKLTDKAPKVEVQYWEEYYNAGTGQMNWKEHWVQVEAKINLDEGKVEFKTPIKNLFVAKEGLYATRVDSSGKGARKVRIKVCKRYGDLREIVESTSGINVTRFYFKDKYLQSDRYFKIYDENNILIRDDTQEMRDYANEILDMHQSEKIKGTLVLDNKGTDYSWDLGQEVRIRNLSGDLGALYSRIESVIYEPQVSKITLQLTEDTYLFNPDFFWRQRTTRTKVGELGEEHKKITRIIRVKPEVQREGDNIGEALRSQQGVRIGVIYNKVGSGDTATYDLYEYGNQDKKWVGITSKAGEFKVDDIVSLTCSVGGAWMIVGRGMTTFLHYAD